MKTHPEVLPEPLTGHIVFHTLSGELNVDTSAEDGTVFMDFPADPPSAVQIKASNKKIAEALGLQEDEIINIEISNALSYVVIEVAQSVDIASIKVNPSELVCH